VTYHPLAYANLPGWANDDHSAALSAFRHSIERLRDIYPNLPDPENTPARRYFEQHFVPHQIVPETGAEQGGGIEGVSSGLFTGYYEPVLQGARQRSGRFHVPLLRRPNDLETLLDDSLRASAGNSLTHARRSSGGLEPYPIRQDIEQGCLDGQGLELLYLESPVDAFFLHVQGSGLVELDDGSRVRVSYAAKNGHPYTSIGKALIADGAISASDMSLQTLAAWLRADKNRAQQLMWRNQSYIFFKELGDAATVSTVGVLSTPLTPGRSLAVDAGIHALGLPMFVAIDDLPGASGPTRRLMIAQDVGSAIRGAVRADIFYGTGRDAGDLAGLTKHPGCLYALLPRRGGTS